MCLGEIAQVVEVHHDGHVMVDIDGIRREVLGMTLSDDDIGPGDWVVINSGFALERITEARAIEAKHMRGAMGPAPHPAEEPTS